MKIKSLIKLVCLLVIVAALGVWAFGANVSMFGKKFIAWDENMLKGNDIGKSNVSVYTISAPKDDLSFDTHAAAINAVEVFKNRAELIGYEDASIRLMGKDRILVALPLKEAQINGGVGIFAYNGKVEVTKGTDIVFNQNDIKKAKISNEYDSTGSSLVYFAEVTFEKDAKAKLQELTSNGSYTFNFALDTDVAKATATGTDVVKNGKLKLSFTDYNAMVSFVLCVNSGAVDGEISWAETSDILSGTAGENATMVLGFAALAILIAAALYFIISNKMLGLAATLSTFIGFIGYEFYAATLPWLNMNAGAVAGIMVAVLLMILAHIVVLNNVSKQYANGRDVVSALDNAVIDARKFILEINCVALVLGILLWIIDAGFASFGVAIIGGAVVTLITSLFVLKFIAKIFIGLGAGSAKAFGLKRGE